MLQGRLPRYELWVVVLVVALTTLTIAGVLRRAGRLGGPAGVTSLGGGVLLTVVMVPIGWGVTLVMTLLGEAVLVACRGSAGDADRFVRPLRWLGAAWLFGAAALLLFDEVYPVGLGRRVRRPPRRVAHAVRRLRALCTALVLALVGARLGVEHPRRPRSATENPRHPRRVVSATQAGMT